jgi:hypothetical protein
MPANRVIRRVVLERSSRPLLVRFLTVHGAAFFAAHDFPLDGLAAAPSSDRALVHHLFDLLHTPSLARPPALLAALAALDALATPNGGDELVRLDVDARLPRATYGDEDLALFALLERPELATEARRAADADRVQSFTEYEPGVHGPLAFGDAEKVALASTLAPRLDAKDRTRLCIIHATRDGDETSLEIVHGRRARTFDKIDAKSLQVDASTDSHTERAFVTLDRRAGNVAIHAAVAVKDLVCESLGEVLASRRDFFRAARVYDLSPFRDLDTALAIDGASPRLRRVELHAISAQTPLGSAVTFARPRQDLLADRAVRDPLLAVLGYGTPVAVKLYLVIDGRERPLKVEIAVNGKKNRVDFDRDDPAIVEVVRSYLRARGVLRDVAPPPVTIAPPAPEAKPDAGPSSVAVTG